MQQNIPNTNRRKLRAFMRIKSFVSPENPTAKQMEKYDKEVNEFLSTIDNEKRLLNGRNSYSIENKIFTMVWYLERIPDEPVSTPFGNQGKEVKPEKNDKDSNSQKAKTK